MIKIIASALFLFLLMTTGSLAQSSEQRLLVCPTGLECVEYEGTLFGIDPSCGPVVSFIVVENLAREENLEGVTETYGLRGIVYLDSGEGYELVGEFSEVAAGSLEGVRFGDVGCLAWEEEMND